MPATATNASSRRIPRSRWIRRQARKRGARWARIFSHPDQAGHHRRPGAGLSVRALSDRLQRRPPPPPSTDHRVSPDDAPRQPGAARLAFRRTLHHRSVRQRLHAAAVRRRRAAAVAVERAFAERGVPLTTVSIDDPAIATLYERALVLVRPDGHVAWRGDAAPPDPLAVVDHVRGAG